jgi:hypothetical protein
MTDEIVSATKTARARELNSRPALDAGETQQLIELAYDREVDVEVRAAIMASLDADVDDDGHGGELVTDDGVPFAHQEKVDGVWRRRAEYDSPEVVAIRTELADALGLEFALLDDFSRTRVLEDTHIDRLLKLVRRRLAAAADVEAVVEELRELLGADPVEAAPVLGDMLVELRLRLAVRDRVHATRERFATELAGLLEQEDSRQYNGKAIRHAVERHERILEVIDSIILDTPLDDDLDADDLDARHAPNPRRLRGVK